MPKSKKHHKEVKTMSKIKNYRLDLLEHKEELLEKATEDELQEVNKALFMNDENLLVEVLNRIKRRGK